MCACWCASWCKLKLGSFSLAEVAVGSTKTEHSQVQHIRSIASLDTWRLKCFDTLSQSANILMPRSSLLIAMLALSLLLTTCSDISRGFLLSFTVLARLAIRRCLFFSLNSGLAPLLASHRLPASLLDCFRLSIVRCSSSDIFSGAFANGFGLFFLRFASSNTFSGAFSLTIVRARLNIVSKFLTIPPSAWHELSALHEQRFQILWNVNGATLPRRDVDHCRSHSLGAYCRNIGFFRKRMKMLKI